MNPPAHVLSDCDFAAGGADSPSAQIALRIRIAVGGMGSEPADRSLTSPS